MKPNFLNLFGLGKTIGSGTSASFGAILIYSALVKTGNETPVILYGVLFLIILICAMGFRNNPLHASQDSREIVMDEFAGMFLSLSIAVTTETIWVGAQLILFRLLDIFKPFPLNYVNRKFKNGFGIMADDLLAGAASGFIIYFLKV